GAGPGYPGTQDGAGLAARFEQIGGLALDGAGNLYIADSAADTIRKLVLSTNNDVSTIAGTANTRGSADGNGTAATFREPLGLAYDSGSLYIVDSFNDTIRRLDVASGAVTTPFGSAGMSGSDDGVGAAARFATPYSLVADGAGDLYVGQAGIVRRLVIGSGAVSTPLGRVGQIGVQPGALPAGLNTPNGLALLPCGGLIILDGNENVVLEAE
ncbi:MAG TPA: hypothetical protein VHB97_24765, partial [Polyangia bacterium]|nr:hypothetical protein [Polyangia bacterium]